MADERTFPDETPTASANIPWRLLEGLRGYGHDHRRVGGFLMACLQNDLREAVLRADPESLDALGDIVLFIYNVMPSQCHGSRKAVEAWLRKESSS